MGPRPSGGEGNDAPHPARAKALATFSPQGQAGKLRPRLGGGFLVLPVVDEVVDNGGIGEGRGVAKI